MQAAENSLDRVPRLRTVPAGVVQAVVMHALQLQPPSREVFILCDIQGFSVTEAATILGTGAKTIDARLKRARRQMDHVITRLCQQGAGSAERAQAGVCVSLY
jgi:DNA-directed RNA polymerase specialized sigma24 family protein